MNTINPAFVPASFYSSDVPTQLTVSKELAETVQAGVMATLDKLPDIGDAYVKSQIQGLAPEHLDTPEELKAVLDRLETAGARIAELSNPTTTAFTGDIAKFLARAMIEFAGQQRQQAADDRLLAREAAKTELLSQAAEMKSAADKMMAGALTNLIVSAVGAGITFASSLTSAIKQGSALKDMAVASKQSTAASKTMNNLQENATPNKSALTGQAKTDVGIDISVKTKAPATPSATATKTDGPATDSALKPGAGAPGGTSSQGTLDNSDKAVATGNRARSNAVTERPESGPASTEGALARAGIDKKTADDKFLMAQTRAQRDMTGAQAFGAIGDMMKSIGGGVDSMMQAQAKYDDAEGKIHEAKSQYYEQIADGKKEVQETMKEMITQIINFIKEMQEAEVDAMRALTKV